MLAIVSQANGNHYIKLTNFLNVCNNAKIIFLNRLSVDSVCLSVCLYQNALTLSITFEP